MTAGFLLFLLVPFMLLGGVFAGIYLLTRLSKRSAADRPEG